MQFVNTTSTSGREKQDNKRLVRSYISKKNRRLAKTRVVAQHHRPANETGQDTGREGSSSSSAAYSTPEQTSRLATNEDRGERTRYSEEATETDAETVCSPDLSLSTKLDSLSPEVFIDYPLDDVCDSARYFLRVIVSNAFLPAQDWFQMFCEEPLVFHGFSAVFNAEQTLRDSYNSMLYRRRMLTHRNTTTQLVNAKLAKLNRSDIEAVILGIFTLYHDDEEIRKTSQRWTNFFVPHLPWADNANMYAGGDPAGTHCALTELVQRAGGLPCLNLPGLSDAMCRNDLILASIGFSKPSFPCLWDVEPSSLTELIYFHLSPASLGTGFDLLAGFLPDTALQTLKDVSCVDRLLAEVRHRKTSPDVVATLVTARNTIHHRLMSLPSGDHQTVLSENEALVYDCCRLTTMLYSHCVIYPVQSGCAGVMKPIERLRVLLSEVAVLGDRSLETFQVRIWSALVASIAAWQTSHRGVICALLLEAILQFGRLQSFETLLTVAKEFVWSDCAGKSAAALVWDYIQPRIL